MTSWRAIDRSASSSTAAGRPAERSTIAFIATYDGQPTAPGQGEARHENIFAIFVVFAFSDFFGAACIDQMYHPARPTEIASHAPSGDLAQLDAPGPAARNASRGWRGIDVA